MNNKLFRTGLVFGVIFLFLGIAIQPITSIEITRNDLIPPIIKIDKSKSVKECDCELEDNNYPLLVEKNLNRLELIVKYISYRVDNPYIKEKFNEILDSLYNDGPICRSLRSLINIITILAGLFSASFVILVYSIILIFIISDIAVKLNCEWILGHNQGPEISNPNPVDGAIDVPLTLNELSFNISDFEGDRMYYHYTTDPDIGSGWGFNKKDGICKIPVSNLESNTTYSWTVVVSDHNSGNEKKYSFTTEIVEPVITDLSPYNAEIFCSN